MKQGDTVPVTISGQVVAQATVKELGDGTVTLVVPGTLVVMAVRTELAPEAVVSEGQAPAAPTSETIITGVDRASAGVSGDALAPPLATPPRQPSAVDAPVGTPEVTLPPVTAPGEPQVGIDAPTNNGEVVVPVVPAETVAPVETVSDTIADPPVADNKG